MGDYNKAANSEQAGEPLELDNFADILKQEFDSDATTKERTEIVAGARARRRISENPRRLLSPKRLRRRLRLYSRHWRDEHQAIRAYIRFD